MKKVMSLLVAMVFAVGGLLTSFSFANGSSPAYQPAVHNDAINFQASYQNGQVVMSWNTFVPTSSNWKYWKVVRSTSKSQPVYPDDGYIKYSSDMNFTSYTDSNPPQWTVYYGVCAITESQRGRFRNCDRQAVNVNGTTITPTPTPTPTTYGLSDAMKAAVDSLVTKFGTKLDVKFGDDNAAKAAFLWVLSGRIDAVIASSSAKNKPLFQYLKTKIEEMAAVAELAGLLDV